MPIGVVRGLLRKPSQEFARCLAGRVDLSAKQRSEADPNSPRRLAHKKRAPRAGPADPATPIGVLT